MVLPLEISKINKTFGKAQILDNISFNVKNNDIFGFVGLNGAGKTTLIKIILDLLDGDSGNITIFSLDKNLPESRKKICYLPEKFQPSKNLKGIEFIKFVLSFYQQKLDEKKLEELCVSLDLKSEALKQKVTKYSKGMTQKLGLIATFLSNADLIILDEPMSGLDPRARIRLKNELVKYKNLGKTIFFSSHILSDIDEICDEIAILHNSKLAFNGTAQNFKAKHSKVSLEESFLYEIGEKI